MNDDVSRRQLSGKGQQRKSVADEQADSGAESHADLKQSNDELAAKVRLLEEELEAEKAESKRLADSLATQRDKFEATTEAAKELRRLLSANEIAAIFLDARLRIRKYTSSTTLTVGLSKDDIGKDVETISDRLGGEEFLAAIARVQDTGKAVEQEALLTDRHLLLRIFPNIDVTNRQSFNDVPLAIAIFDISSIKSAEEKQSRLALLIDHSSDFIVSTDGEGQIETWNRGAEDMIGISRDDVIGRSFTSTLAKHVTHMPFRQFFERRQLDESHGVADWTIHRDGQVVNIKVDWRAALQRDAAGRVSAISFIARDVSDVAEANRRVAASEHELRRVMSGVTEAIVVIDDDWKFIFVNEGMCKLLDSPLDALLGRSIWDTFLERDHPSLKEALRTAKERGEATRFEEFVPATARWYQCHCFPSEGRMTVFFADITELRHTNDLLRQQAEMLELSHDAILAWSPEEGITFWNRGAELLYGYSRHEVIGKRSHMVLQTESEIPMDEVLEIIRERGDWEGRLIHQTRHNQRLQIASRHQLIKSAIDGKEIVLEINRDMTEYDDLSSRLAQLASIADLTTDFVGTAKATGEILYVNHGAAKLLGYDSPEDLRGMRIEDVHPNSVAEVLQKTALPAAATGEAYQFESELLSKDGSVIPISQVVMAHKNQAGVVTHYSTIARDISAQKNYEIELETMRDVAESANRAKSAFLAQMSHEIRTPMTAILGCGEQLQDSVESNENKQLSRVMVEQGHALMSILDDILDLSRIEAEKIALQFRPVDPQKVLRDLHRLMMPRAEETGLNFHLNLEGDFPARIVTDGVRLRQILVNLLSNAFKFTPEGEVALKARCLHLSERHELLISVADSGVGIASADLQGIFEAFSRLQNPKANAAGTGLGLTIANRLTERLGGHLDVESSEGRGTTFTLRFPVPDPAETEYVPAAPELATARNRLDHQSPEPAKKLPIHVLVAEDTEPIRFLLATILKPAVEKLTIVENGAAAVEATVSDDSISLILLDMQMPVMSGIEAAKRIRAEGFTLPIIALTAGAMDADRTNCVEAGCSEFLSKPVNKRILLDLIEELSDQSQ